MDRFFGIIRSYFDKVLLTDVRRQGMINLPRFRPPKKGDNKAYEENS